MFFFNKLQELSLTGVLHLITPIIMTVSISINEDLVEAVKVEAKRNHRSLSGQIAFFCAQGVGHPVTPDTKPPTTPQPTTKAKS